MVLLNPCNRLKFAPNMPLLPDLYYRSTVYDSFIGSVRSSSGDHGLIEIQQQQQGHFSKFSNLEQSCLYTFIIHFHFHSVFMFVIVIILAEVFFKVVFELVSFYRRRNFSKTSSLPISLSALKSGSVCPFVCVCGV